MTDVPKDYIYALRIKEQRYLRLLSEMELAQEEVIAIGKVSQKMYENFTDKKRLQIADEFRKMTVRMASISLSITEAVNHSRHDLEEWLKHEPAIVAAFVV